MHGILPKTFAGQTTAVTNYHFVTEVASTGTFTCMQYLVDAE